MSWRNIARVLLVLAVGSVLALATTREVSVPPQPRTSPFAVAPLSCASDTLEPPDGWGVVPPIVTGTGPVVSIQALTSDDTGDVVFRFVTSDGRAPLIFFDTDGDRLHGSWTYQTPVSGTAWNLHVDQEGALYTHTGGPDVWAWEELRPPASYRWEHDGFATVVCVPADLIDETFGRLSVAAELDDQWLPDAFLPGIEFPPVTQPLIIEPVRTPERLAFAYQWAPWAVRGCDPSGADLRCAVEVYGSFGHVVFGGGIEDPEHPSHEVTARLIAALRSDHPDTEVWGYVSLLRHRDVWHDTEHIARRSRAWADIGVTGIFLDEYDLCEQGWRTCRRRDDGTEVVVTRADQRAAVRAIHDLGLPVFANAHSIHGALGSVRGVPTPLGGGDGERPADMYLLENPTAWGGRWWTGLDRLAAIARFRDAPEYVAETGVRLAVVDTGAGEIGDDPSYAPYAASWWRALLAGADAHAFTNDVYSATDAMGQNLAILGLPPGGELVDEFDLRFVGPVKVNESGRVSRRLVTDCTGSIVGELRVEVDDDGRVTGGLHVQQVAECEQDTA